MSSLQKTKIGWTDFTWNPWVGCTKVSEGCKNCYMFAAQGRRGQKPEVVRRTTTTFTDPLKKDRQKEYKIPDGSKVFVCSYSDFFHPDADEWRPEAWEIIKQRPDVIFQIVTKRTNDLASRLPADWGDGYPNVWLIVSVEETKMLPRVQKLLKIPAVVHGVSYEPALEDVDFRPYMFPAVDENLEYTDPEAPLIDWIIVGGESGDNARPFQLKWARETVKDCKHAGVAVFVKQMGQQPMDGNEYVQLKHQKGEDLEEWEAGLQVQDFPPVSEVMQLMKAITEQKIEIAEGEAALADSVGDSVGIQVQFKRRNKLDELQNALAVARLAVA